MSYQEALEKEYQKYLIEPANQLGFKVYDQMSDKSGGALIRLKNRDLRIELLNDRGIINLNVGPATGIQLFFDFELIASFISLNKNTEPLTKMRRKKIIKNRIGLKDQIAILTANYTDLKELFSKKKFRQTIKQLDELGEERFNNSI